MNSVPRYPRRGITASGRRALVANGPPLRVNGQPTVGSGADASMVGTTTRSDGNPLVTYNGHPLYLYSGDQNPATRTAKA
jgi:predicted lipoprotein with Yx(FWY)xxD motif